MNDIYLKSKTIERPVEPPKFIRDSLNVSDISKGDAMGDWSSNQRQKQINATKSGMGQINNTVWHGNAINNSRTDRDDRVRSRCVIGVNSVLGQSPIGTKRIAET